MNEKNLYKLDKKTSFGDTLKSVRENKGLSLENIAKKINIRQEYLTQLENNRSDLLPAGIYRRGFLKKYAEFLGIDQVLINNKLNEIEADKDDPFANKTVSRNHLISFPKIIKLVIFSLIVLFCILYLSFYIKKITSPPELIITQPADNLLTSERSINIVGSTDKEAELKINGELFLGDNNGNFSKTVNLKSGLNNIEISSKKKYSKENTIIKQVLVE